MDKLNKVLVLGGNHDQMPYIKELKSRGYWVALTDLNETCPGKTFADEFQAIGYEDVDKLLDYVGQLQLSSDCKIFTASAQFAYIGAATIAEHLGISYPNVSTIEMCLDKAEFYKKFETEGVPIPETQFVGTRESLDEVLKNADHVQSFYLKSDFSKNPSYVYKLKATDERNHIFWGRDRYLRNTYILQPEFFGSHIRLNLFDGNFNLFDFKTNTLLDIESDIHNVKKNNIVNTLHEFTKLYKLNHFLVKFDIVVNDDSWVALDIGLDPPSRMKKYADEHAIDFVKFYVDFMLNRFIDLKEIGSLSF